MKLKHILFIFLAPLTLREIISISVQYNDAQWLTVTGENEPMEKVFQFAYIEFIARGLRPQSVMFDVKPHSTDRFMKAYNLSEQLMKAL